jgi:hypothetical protein
MARIERVPAGENAAGVMPGDFILCHRRGFVAWMIRLGERLRLHRADVSHAAFCEDADTLIEALTHGTTRTPLNAYRDIEYWIVRALLVGDDAEQAVVFARTCLGATYGFVTDLGIALRFLTPGRGLWFGMTGTEICSGLVAQTQVRGWAIFPVEPAAISPQELFDFYAPRALERSPMSNPTQTEQSVITHLLTSLASILGPLSPFAKAVVPAVLAVVVAGVNSAFAGKVDTVSLTIAGSGLVLALVAYLVPNVVKPAPAPAPVPAPAAK